MHFSFLINCDPFETLGGSCDRDLLNTVLYLDDRFGSQGTFSHQIFVPRKSVSKFKHLEGSSRLTVHTLEANKDTSLLSKLQASIQKIPKGSVVVVLVSGHGYQRRESTRGNETDGMDEFIRIHTKGGERCAVTDDELYKAIVAPCPEGVNMVLLADTCHSGTLFDLDSSEDKKNVVSFAACTDSQLSSCDIGERGFGGSLTAHILENDRLKRLVDDLQSKHQVLDEMSPILAKLRQKCVMMMMQQH